MYFLLLKVLLHDNKNYNKREITIFFIIYLLIRFVSNLDYLIWVLWLRFSIQEYQVIIVKLIPRCTIQASLVTSYNFDIGRAPKTSTAMLNV